jgi:hypothetical protein
MLFLNSSLRDSAPIPCAAGAGRARLKKTAPDKRPASKKKATVGKRVNAQLSKIIKFVNKHSASSASLFTATTNRFANKMTAPMDMLNHTEAYLKFYGPTRTQIVKSLFDKREFSIYYYSIEPVQNRAVFENINELVQ